MDSHEYKYVRSRNRSIYITYLPSYLPIYLNKYGARTTSDVLRETSRRKGDDGDLSLLVVLTDVATTTRKQDSQNRAMFEYCMRACMQR